MNNAARDVGQFFIAYIFIFISWTFKEEKKLDQNLLLYVVKC